ncbi:MAG: glycosyltransferase, partial [Chloroflexota bacterium]|nr:glycosyltransferase [Chloroflexota bacterium]
TGMFDRLETSTDAIISDAKVKDVEVMRSSDECGKALETPWPSAAGTGDRQTEPSIMAPSPGVGSEQMPSAADVSVVICAYSLDRWSDLVAAVQSVSYQSIPPREIVVVVDHNPTLLELVRTRLPEVIAVENHQARGLSGARNSGITAASGAILAFLDDDAVAGVDWLARLAAAFVDPRVVGVGGAVEPQWADAPPRWFPEEFLWVVGCTYRGMPKKTAPIRNPIGANMAFRREVFDQIGGFQSAIGRLGSRPVGCEETELCIRAGQQWPDRELRFEPQARVWHRVPSRRAGWSYFWSRCFAEGLSKALVSKLVGPNDGLSSERAYTLRTLPSGALNGLRDGLVHGDLGGPARAAVIVAGLVITTAGYITGKVNRLTSVTGSGNTGGNKADNQWQPIGTIAAD